MVGSRSKVGDRLVFDISQAVVGPCLNTPSPPFHLGFTPPRPQLPFPACEASGTAFTTARKHSCVRSSSKLASAQTACVGPSRPSRRLEAAPRLQQNRFPVPLFTSRGSAPKWVCCSLRDESSICSLPISSPQRTGVHAYSCCVEELWISLRAPRRPSKRIQTGNTMPRACIWRAWC